MSAVKTPSLDPKPETSGSEAEGKALVTALRPPAQTGWFDFIHETSSGEIIGVRGPCALRRRRWGSAELSNCSAVWSV